MFNLTPTVRNLLFANLLFFIAQISFLPQLTQIGSLYPLGSPYFQPWQFVTDMFLHAGWGHILSNMFGLISFGPLLEQRWGGRRLLIFWMVCGLGAGVLYEGVRYYEIHKIEVAQADYHRTPSGGDFAAFFRENLPNADPSSYEAVARELQLNPQNQELISSTTATIDAVVNEILSSPHGGMLGASGALFGILFAFAYLFPNTELMLLFFPFPIKAKYLVFFYAVYELYKGVYRTPGDNVAHFAHLAGMLIGFIIIKVWEQGRQKFY
jgi:membrane associated rhomboid family serine protease